MKRTSDKNRSTKAKKKAYERKEHFGYKRKESEKTKEKGERKIRAGSKLVNLENCYKRQKLELQKKKTLKTKEKAARYTRQKCRGLNNERSPVLLSCRA